jgi:mannitol operon repressor
MSSDKSSPIFTVQPDDWAFWSKELQSESDRGLVIIAASILDHLIARLIEVFVVYDPPATKKLLDDPFSPLGNFAPRTLAAYSLGLISKDERDDLDTIRKIRNEYAHEPKSTSFTDQKIMNKVNNLKTPKLVPVEIHDWNNLSTRQLFINAVSMLSTFIDMRTQLVIDHRRIPPKKFIIQVPPK